MDLRYSNLNPFKSLAYLKVSNNTKAYGLKSKIFQLCAFFCAYFISGGTFTDIPLLKRLRLLSSKGT